MCSLEKLWGEVEGDFERWGFYAEGGGGGPARQGGVFRTNCIDCLDRTNVVQVGPGRAHRRRASQFALGHPAQAVRFKPCTIGIGCTGPVRCCVCWPLWAC